MSQVMKGFMGIFLLLLLAVSALGLLGGFLQVLRAQSFHSGVICELEDSDYASAVIEECLQKGKENGYALEVTVFYKTGGNLILTREEQVSQITKDVDLARVEMTFDIRIPLFGIESTQRLSGYGR